jgi:hypothetical protein
MSILGDYHFEFFEQRRKFFLINCMFITVLGILQLLSHSLRYAAPSSGSLVASAVGRRRRGISNNSL